MREANSTAGRGDHLRKSVALISAIVACFLIGAARSYADAADTAGQAAGGSQQLEEVVVTATRRSESSFNTALGVDAIPGSALQTYGVTSLQDLNTVNSSLNVNNFGATQQQLVIRGISSNIAATTGLYLDESPLVGGFQNNFRGDGTPGIRLIDIERVEVLKGPQGTLFGSGSMDGTVRLISNKPNLTSVGGSVTVDAATVEHGNALYGSNLVLNAPLNDTFGVRLVGWGEWGGGFINQTINGQTLDKVNNTNLVGGRFTALWKPLTDLTLTGSVNYQNANVNGVQYWNPSAGTWNNNEQSRAPYHDDYTLFNVTGDYDFHVGDLIGVFTHGKKNTLQPFDSTPTNCGFGLCPPIVPPLSFVPQLAFSDTTGELRFVSKFSGPVQLVVGGYYEHDQSTFNGSAVYDNPSGYVGCINLNDCEAKGLRQPGNNFTGVPVNFLEFGTIDTTDIKQYAAYAQIDWKIIDPLTLTVGARYFSATISDVVQSTQDIAPPNACNWVFGCVTTPYVTFDGSTKQNKTTYNFALLYNITPNVNVYARAASGFRIGGINTDYNPANLPQVPLSFEPDSLWNYEAGIKTYMLERTLFLDLAVYHIDWTNQHINAIAEGAFEYTLNAGKTKTDGAELAINWLVTHGFTLNGAIAYNHARLAETLPPPVTAAGNGGNAGDPLPLSPKVVASLAGTYDFPISSGVGGYATAGVNYRDSTQLGFNSTNTFYAQLPPYWLANAKFGVRWNHYDLGLFVDNITDKAAYSGLQVTTDGTRVFSPRPRTIGLSFTGSF
jgi:outer membrane receptor protein involved in Fe transport